MQHIGERYLYMRADTLTVWVVQFRVKIHGYTPGDVRIIRQKGCDDLYM